MVNETVSRRLKVARRERGLSIRRVAAMAGVSPSLLSQIERGTASPSLVSLVAIADALAVRPGELLDDDEAMATSRVVRRADRRTIEDPLCRREYLMHTNDPYLEVAELILPPGGSNRPALASHTGRDYSVVLTGTVIVEFEDGQEELETGDYIAFDSSSPHRLVNRGDEEARVIWLIARDARSRPGAGES